MNMTIDSIGEHLKGLAEYRSELNAARNEVIKNLDVKEVSIDDIIWATDRGGQEEVILPA